MLNENMIRIYSERPKMERSVWQTKRKIVQFEIVRLVPIVQKLNKMGSNPVWNRFSQTEHPNELNEKWFGFRTCPKTELFDNRKIMETSEI